MKTIKGTDVGLSGIDQIKIAIKAIDKYHGKAQMSSIYKVFEEHIYPNKLSKQGKASLRFFVNKVAVEGGYIYPHDPKNKGWRATQKGYEMIGKAKNKYYPWNIPGKDFAAIPSYEVGLIRSKVGIPQSTIKYDPSKKEVFLLSNSQSDICTAVEYGGWEHARRPKDVEANWTVYVIPTVEATKVGLPVVGVKFTATGKPNTNTKVLWPSLNKPTGA